MKILFIILVLGGIWYWNSSPADHTKAVESAASAASSASGTFENIEQWLRDHTPKK